MRRPFQAQDQVPGLCDDPARRTGGRDKYPSGCRVLGMTLFDSPSFEDHEGIHAFSDEKSGLKCIIAVHSTARGPAAGGCRMWPYASADDALEDALKLSRAMSYKNAMADLALGGGKSVILGDSRTQKSPALFEAFGRAIEAVGGRYWTAEDVGVSPEDLASARKHTR